MIFITIICPDKNKGSEMNTFIVFTSIFVILATTVAVPLGNPEHEVHVGNCRKTSEKDMVFQKCVRLIGIPFLVRDDTVSSLFSVLSSFKRSRLLTTYI